MALYQDLEFRGLVKQVTDPQVEKELDSGKLTFYVGFDPTSDSLHIGSFLPLITMRRLQLAGHRPVAVVGGATGRIGDPSGKSAERSLLSIEDINRNLRGIEKVIRRFLSFEGPAAAKVVNNYDFFDGVTYLDFLRDVGKHFTVNSMLAKESVRARLEDREHGISYTEFSYMLIQAYDFYVLNKHEGCRLQMGGSDQWGNITAGTELIRRMAAAHGKEAPQVYGLTLPLIMKADGTKFGKSESGALWLDAEKTSPYQLYQYLLNTGDADVIQLIKYFSFLPHDEIRALERTVAEAPEKREAQKRLAEEVTRIVHGDAGVEQARSASQALFSGGVKGLDASTLKDVLGDAPTTLKPRTALPDTGLSLVELLAETGLCPSKGQARKDIQAGGIYLNDERVSDVGALVKPAQLIGGKHLVLRKGKKNYHLVSFEG